MKIQNTKLLFVLVLVFLNFELGMADDCHWVPDHCPVWNGWSDPKCHVDDEVCNGDVCSVTACTYCAAKAFGCSVDLQGGVPGSIFRI